MGFFVAPPLFVLVWSTGFIVARLVAPYADPLLFLMIRYGCTIAALIVILKVAAVSWPRTRLVWRNGIISGMLVQGCYLGAVFWSVKHGLPAGFAALLAGLQPLLTGLLAKPLLNEFVSRLRWMGIITGFSGAFLVLGPKLPFVNGGIALAPLLVCFSGLVSITLGSIWQKKRQDQFDLRADMLVQNVGAALITLPLLILDNHIQFDPSPALFAGLFWAVFGLSIGGILLLLSLIRRGDVAKVASLLYLVPPVSALMAYGLFGETLTLIQVVGMTIAALGVALASRG